MADDLDQGYMQTRQTMRDWQNRMLFMEPTQEGHNVYMGVQMGGKETDGKGVAPPPTPAEEAIQPTAGPVEGAVTLGMMGRTQLVKETVSNLVNAAKTGSIRYGMEQVRDRAGSAPDATLPPEKKGLGELGTEIIGKTDEGRPIVKNPDGSVSTERTTTLQIDGKWTNIPTMYGGKEVSDEEAVAIIKKNGMVDPETGRKMPTFDSMQEAEAAARKRSEEDLGKYSIPQRKTITVDTPEVAAVRQQFKEKTKPYVFDLDTFDVPGDVVRAGLAKLSRVDRGDKEGTLRMSSDEMVNRVFFQYGEKPEEVIKRAEELGLPEADTLKIMAGLSAVVLGMATDPLNFTTGSKAKDVGKATRIAREGMSPPKQNRTVFENGKGFDDEHYQTSIKVRVEWADALLPDPTGPTGVKRGMDFVEDEIKGLNAGHALRRAAENWPDATRIQIIGEPSRSAIIEEFKRAASILKSERGSVPLGGGGAGKPPDVPPVNIGGAAEEPISPKALATISRREQAKSDFTIKVEGFKDELTKQRRGPVLSDEAVRKLAGESGFTLQDLLDLKPGSILAPEIQVAARDVFKASADKMKASAKAYLERADPQAFDEFAQAFAEAGIATTRIIGTFAEGGRTFRLFNQKYPTLKTGVKPGVKDPEFSIQDQYIQEMYKFFRGVEEKSAMGGFEGARGGAAQPGMVSPAQLAQMVMDLPNEEAIMKFAKEAVKPTWGDMMMEVWINGLLSGPITHSTNIISNAATLAWNIPERAVASMLNPKAVRPGEAAAMLGGVVESMGDAWRLAWKAFKEEQPQFGQAKLEMPRRAITADALEVTGMTGRAVDFLGAAVRLPGRFLMAGDDFFKAIAFRAELRALAKRQAFREINEMSLTGKAAAQKAKEIEKNILDNPPESIKEAAQEFAAYTTFTRDLGETGQKVQALASTPIGRIVLPFVRTPTNIFKFAGERTPLALASRAVREEIAAGGERRALALAKIGLGSMTMAYMGTLAANGLITGGGPKDKTLRQIKMQTGWKPYSFKIGNEYISYARIEPLGSLFGLAADAADIMGQLSEADAAKLASALTVAISRNVAQKTFVKGLAGTLNAVTSQEVKQVNSFLEKELPTILPYSSALGQTAKNVDPVMREVNSIMDAFKAKLPGYSSDLPPHRNIWGEPVLLEGGFGPDLLSPFYSSTVKDDKVAEELSRLEAPIRLPSKQIDRVPLTPWQYDAYQQLAAHPTGADPLRQKLEELIASDTYKSATNEGKITLIRQRVDTYRDLAAVLLGLRDRDVGAKLDKRKQEKASMMNAPGGLSR